MTTFEPGRSPATRVTPGLRVSDEWAAYWVARIILMLRREVAWCWHTRDPQGIRASEPEPLPPVIDATYENLDLPRVEEEKARFFATDAAAQYLTEQMERLQMPEVGVQPRGSWAWLVKELELEEVSQFLLALVFTTRLDGALGPVLATCMNDRSRPFVTLALAQRLWPDALAILGLGDAAHPLFRFGLLHTGEGRGEIGWLTSIDMPAMVARWIAEPQRQMPRALRPLSGPGARAMPAEGKALADRFRANAPRSMDIVPVIGQAQTDFEDWVGGLAHLAGGRVAAIEPAACAEPGLLKALAVVAWMGGMDLMLPDSWAGQANEKQLAEWRTAVESIPLRWYVPVSGQEFLGSLPQAGLTAAMTIPPLTFEERSARFKSAGALAESVADECSRRFRLQEKAILRVTRTIRGMDGQADQHSLLMACRAEATSAMGRLAQQVMPRFQPGELVLAPQQQQQYDELVRAMLALTEVHYRWGTAAVWNECGLAGLFGGPPGTGKTMAAETLAKALEMPMYRVDLSQVVNKYIGETEKNLKQIFDAAELSDCILFFDEADALFGKRTEVKDAHDRFANIEISYLLERMERFKGLAILATNRKKDLDEAFIRRLRYVIDFPPPGVEERQRIWRQVFPSQVDTSGIDFGFLARQFSLTGGHIRSISFAACLQAAGGVNGARKVDMETVLLAVRRELEKMNRAAGDSLFGRHEETMRGMGR